VMIGSFGGGFGRGLGGFSFDPRKIPTAKDLSRFGLGSIPTPVSVAPPPVIPAPPPAPPRPAPVAPKPTYTPPPLKYDRMGRPIVNKIPDSALPPELRVTPPPPVAPRPQPVAPKPVIAPPVTTAPTAPIASPTPAPVTPPNRVGQPVSGGEFIPEPTTPSPVTAAPTAESIKTRGENKPIAAKDAIESYKNTLLSAADENVYDTVDDVDEVDDFYDRVFRNTVIDPLDPKAAIDRSISREGIQAEGIDKAIKTQDARKKPKLDFTPDQYLSEVGGSEYLKGLKGGVGVDTDTVKSAFGTIANTSGADTAAALSNYYGFEITPSVGESNISNFGGNYEEHTTASQAEIAEFQSLIKPVLAETIPYLQATEGLGYQDALLESFKRDPMVQSLYAKYGVQPVRQTKDGSTYLYDPMTFGEIRTKEVKDTSVKDALKIAGIVGLSVFGGGALAGTAAFGGGTSAAGTALAKGLTSAGVTALTGGDTNDILKSFALAGAGGYAKGLNANAADLASKAAKNAFTLGAAAPDPALIEAANAAANTADTFNKVIQGAKFIDAAVDGNIAGAAVSAFGPTFTKAAMDKVKLNEEFLESYNINQDDVVAGLVKTQLELTKGTDFGDAIFRGFGEYIMEGGALGPNNIETPKFIKMIGDAIKESGKIFDDAVLQPINRITKPIIEGARAVGRTVDDEVLEPIKEAIEDAGSAVDDAVVQPIREVAKAVDDTVIQPAREVAKAVDDTVIQPIREAAKDVDLPDVDLPDVDLPDVDLPDLDLAAAVDAPSGTTGFGVQGPSRVTRRQTIYADEIAPYARTDRILELLTGNKPVVRAASGGMISDDTLDSLLRIIGDKR